MNLESASGRQALRRSASFFQRLVLWIPCAHARFIWNAELASRRSASFCWRLVLWIQITYSLEIEPRTIFQGYGHCFCNLIFETNNFGLSAILLSCLVSELQKTPSPGIELRILFRSFDPPIFSSWSQRISMWSLVQTIHLFSSYKRTNKHKLTISTLYVRLFRRPSASKGERPKWFRGKINLINATYANNLRAEPEGNSGPWLSLQTERVRIFIL
jgi:hypothetical protein